eukprot:TRINITY_DN13951_c0_g1_i4.p1 TRINITY_DN13951_c0_g1~~TRINITY_DN13951_c0_g1_i4.p1  ORF type:complete len:597 (+),score=128.04 TRINITY_DN13951_c0_g1_i4:68-1792(+)
MDEAQFDPYSVSILVIDDEKLARLALTKMLQKLGYRKIIAVEGAVEAFTYLEQHANDLPGLILCDVKMPGINGVEFLQICFTKPNYKDIPVVMISGMDELQLVYTCLKEGATDFLTKPLHVKQLENIWQSMWRKKKEMEKLAKDEEKQLKFRQEMEVLMKEVASTPVKAIVKSVSEILGSGNINPETRETLGDILKILHNSKFYRPTIESCLVSKNDFNDIDPETREWLIKELGLTHLEKLQEVRPHLEPINSFSLENSESLRTNDFDVWTIQQDSVLNALIIAMFDDFGILKLFEIEQTKFKNFLMAIQHHYLAYNPYHNFRHAFDVLHATYLFLSNCKASTFFVPSEILSLMLASLLHDVGHTGQTNAFHIETCSKLAIKYNNQSVLENYHCSLGWKLMVKFGILNNIPPAEIKNIRNFYISLVLATDMSKHFELLVNFEKIVTSGLDRDKEEHRKVVSKLLIKCADLSNPAKPFHITRYWALMVQEEFFRQGDKEKELGLPYSPFSERGNSSLCQMQMNFVDYIVIPLYNSLAQCFPLIMEVHMPTLLQNRTKWGQLKAIEESEEIPRNCT